MLLYLDCFSGISGDMILGSLLDCGASLEKLKEGLGALPLKGYSLRAEKAKRGSLWGTSLEVDIDEAHGVERSFGDIVILLEESRLSDSLKQKAKGVFRLLAEAEASLHNRKVDEVRFHEVGAVDAIVDVVGCLLLLEQLGVDEVYASPVHLGNGMVESAHGPLPLPAPATLKILQGVPVFTRGFKAEMTTPTGAALLKHLAKGFGPLPTFTLKASGFGVGKRDMGSWPNLLRVIIGHREANPLMDRVTLLETCIDDMSPENCSYIMERLLREGALEAYFTPYVGKKSRPGVMLSVLCEEDKAEDLARCIFEESTTFGLRISQKNRLILKREFREIESPWGKARVKVGSLGERVVSLSPEYEDCQKIATEQHVPLKDVFHRIKEEARRQIMEEGAIGKDSHISGKL